MALNNKCRVCGVSIDEDFGRGKITRLRKLLDEAKEHLHITTKECDEAKRRLAAVRMSVNNGCMSDSETLRMVRTQIDAIDAILAEEWVHRSETAPRFGSKIRWLQSTMLNKVGDISTIIGGSFGSGGWQVGLKENPLRLCEKEENVIWERVSDVTSKPEEEEEE